MFSSPFNFLLHFSGAHKGRILFTALLMSAATFIFLLFPFFGEELVTFTTETEKTTETPKDDFYTHCRQKLTEWEMVLFSPLIYAGAALFVESISPDTKLLLSHAFALGASIISYHLVSLLAHLSAYRVSMRVQHSIITSSLATILSTEFPERVMMLDGSVITGIVTSNAKLCGNSVARFLTDVLYLCLSVIGLAGMLIFLSCRLTLIIGVLIVSVQLFYLFAGKSNRKKGTEVNHAETTAHSYLTNAIRRSETISIFNCAPFVVDRLESTFADLQRLSSSLNFSIHGYAALSSGSTNLIFVIVLVLANYYHRQGSLELTDIAMYFMLFQSFVRTLSYLAEEANSFRSMINGTAVLYQLMNWYQEVRVPAEGDDKRVCFIPEEDTTTPVELKAVAFAYPEIPSFLETQFQSLSTVGGEELKTKKGITDISFSVPQHSITVLFGQSGCGKSTSLRILGGILQPSGGTVNTRKNAILLEQQHAIFFGSVAENIMLKDLSLCADEHTERVQKACAKGGCDVFIKNPFREMISNTDKPPFSGGQLQRICLARLFANCDDCSLILFDEPTTGLDATRVKSLLETISLLRDTYKKTVVIASHDERVLNFADHVVTFK